VILTTWNSNALANCTAPHEAHYPIEQAGNWVDCVRLKRPVVYNDFPNSPNRKGLPDGHVAVKRFMSVPVVEYDKVRIIFGVGNKVEPYEDDDVVQIQLVANELHKIVRQRSAEVSIRETESRYRSLFDRSLDAVYVHDMEGRFVDANPAALSLLGYSREEIGGLTFEDILDPNDLAVARATTEEITQAGSQKAPTIYRLIRKDGSRVEVETVAVALERDGLPRLIQGVARDLTPRREAEKELAATQEQLRQSQKLEAIGRLAGGIAHDFNNMLGAIIGYSDVILRDLRNEDPIARDIEQIKKAADRAAALTKQLLAFSRKQVLEPRVINLNSVVTGIEKMLRRLIGEDIGFSTGLAQGLWHVRADPGQIEQVIMNLAVNARDAMPAGGQLTIETVNVELDEQYARNHVAVTPGPHVMLAVSDTGCGMDEKIRARLFEPFFTTKEQGKGTGLGLSTVYGIVKQSGGNIWVYSEPGKGTTFKVYFPRVRADTEAIPAKQPEREPHRGTETVLVAEDEEVLRRLVSRILSILGYEVLEASNGGEALIACQKHKGPIHLLVTDVVMPGMSGRELSRRLTETRPDLKVLYTSGYTDNAIVHHGVLDPGTAFIQKPFSASGLAAKVREMLDKGEGGA
jgi:PAS domain S-box-containing protein